MKKIYTTLVALFMLAAITQSSLAQGTKQRIIGYRYNFNYDLVMTDSFRYTYSNGRGSTNKDNELFDTKTTAINAGDKERMVSQFDANGNAVLTEFQQIVAGNWITLGRYTSTYNSGNKLTEKVIQQLVSNVWFNFIRYTATYNTFNDTTSEIQYQADTAGNWVMSQKVTHVYDNKRQRTARFLYIGSSPTPNDTLGAFYYTYDADGNNTLIEVYGSDTANLLQPDTRFENQYDTAHRIVNKLEKKMVNGAWVPQNQDVYYYDNQGRLTRHRNFYGDNMGGLKLYNQFRYTYNTLNVKDSLWTDVYDDNLVDFRPDLVHIYTYSADTLLAEDATIAPNNNNVWVPYGKFNYQYNAAKNLTYERQTLQAGWPTDTPGGEWFYYYEDYTPVTNTGISKVEGNSIRVYPNPAQQYFNVSLNPRQYKTLTMVNVIGETILQLNIDEAAAIIYVPTMQVATGLYLLQLSDGKSITSAKLLIE